MTGIVRKDFQILRAIVLFVLIPMMHHLRGQEGTPQHLRRDEAMLKNVVRILPVRDRLPDEHVAIWINVPTAAPRAVRRSPKPIPAMGLNPESRNQALHAP